MAQNKEPLDVAISAMVEESLRDDITRLANEGDRSFSAEVRRALRLHVLAQMRISNLEEAS